MKSKYIGVSYHTNSKKWRAQIGHLGRIVHIGLFVTEQQAARAFDTEALRLRGDGTKLNFPNNRSCNNE